MSLPRWIFLPLLVLLCGLGLSCCASPEVIRLEERLEKMDSDALSALVESAQGLREERAWAAYLLGIRSLESGDRTRAMERLKQAADTDPDGRSALHALYELGKIHERLLDETRQDDHSTKAQACYARVAERFAGSEVAAHALHRAASLAAARRELVAAVAHYGELVEHYRRYRALPDAVLGYINCLTRLGNTAQALKIAGEFKAGFPENPYFIRRLRFAVAVARERAGEKQIARELFEALIRDAPGSQEAALARKTLERL